MKNQLDGLNKKIDLVINGQVIDKSRPSIEPQIYQLQKLLEIYQ